MDILFGIHYVCGRSQMPDEKPRISINEGNKLFGAFLSSISPPLDFTHHYVDNTLALITKAKREPVSTSTADLFKLTIDKDNFTITELRTDKEETTTISTQEVEEI